MSDLVTYIVGLLAVAIVTFMAMSLIRDVFGRPVAWVIGVMAMVFCVVALYRTFKATNG